jgi:hypothetical protein
VSSAIAVPVGTPHSFGYPTVMGLPALAIPTAVFAAVRGAWLHVTGRSNGSLEFGPIRSRAMSWTRKAAAHIVGQRLRRTWLLYYVLDRYIAALDVRHVLQLLFLGL